MMANGWKCGILVDPKWDPKWSRKSTKCDKRQKEEESCKDMRKRSNSWALDSSSEGFPPARESYFHFYSSAQKMIKKGVKNELFWTTLAPGGLQNADLFSTQNLRTFSKQIVTPLPPSPPLRDGRNPPSLGSKSERKSFCRGLYRDILPKAPFLQNLVF